MPPLTGLVGIYGTEIARAGLIACDDVNQNGGVLGRPLELIIEDDASLPESAVAAAEKLVKQDKCAAIIGNLLSNSRIAVAYSVAEPNKVPLLNFSFYEGSIISRYFFHFAALPNQQIDRMIPYMRDRFGPRMFFAGNNYEWPRGSIHAGKLALQGAGGIAVGEEYCSIGVSAEEIEALLDQVEDSAPDVFVPYFAGADQLALLTRFTERGLKKRMAVVMGHYDEMMASNLAPEIREDFYSVNTYFMSVDTPGNRDFLTRLAEFSGVTDVWPNGNGILTNFGEGTFVCVKAFAKAANRAGSLETEALIDALEHIELEAPQGPVEMKPEHHHARVNTYLSRCDADGVFSIIESFGTIDPVLPDRYRHQIIRRDTTLEEEFRVQARILQMMSEAVFLVRLNDQSIVYANPAAEINFDRNAQDMSGLRLSEIFGNGDDSAIEKLNDVFATLVTKGNWQGEISKNGKGNSNLTFTLSASTFTHPFQGEVCLFVLSDITEQKQAEEKLRQAQKMEVVGQLTGGVAHDFNNLLAVVIGNLEMIADKLPPDSPEFKFTRNAFNAAERGASLTHHLLAFSRQQVLQPKVIDIRQVIANTAEMTAVSVGEKISMGVQVTSNVWRCKVDQVQLQNAILNLSLNARDAMPSGGNVTISAENTVIGDERADELDVAPGAYVCLSVRDSGPGIPEDVLEHVYEPFFTTKDVGEGSGLGLSMVYGFATQSDGAVDIETAEGEGTTVRLYFPAVQADVEANAETESEEDAAVRSTPDATILLVEDNASFRDITARILDCLNFEVTAFGTAEEALEVIDGTAKFDLLLSDIGLPGDMNGHDLAEYAASARPGLKIVLMSAHTDPEIIGGVIADNVSAFIRKPHRKVQLNKILRQVLQLESDRHATASSDDVIPFPDTRNVKSV